jgi:hypothetical protein
MGDRAHAEGRRKMVELTEDEGTETEAAPSSSSSVLVFVDLARLASSEYRFGCQHPTAARGLPAHWICAAPARACAWLIPAVWVG